MSSLAKEYFYSLDKHRYTKIVTTIFEMMADRGYEPIKVVHPDSDPESETEVVIGTMSAQEWLSKLMTLIINIELDEMNIFSALDQMSLLFQRKNKQTLVYFYILDVKFPQDEMSYIFEYKKKFNVDNTIIITRKEPTPKVANVLTTLTDTIQIFRERELLLNVPKHQLVPKHTRTNKEERQTILDTFTKREDGQVHAELLPGICITDPVVKYYNWRIGDLIRIEQPRKDGFYDLTYRIVSLPIDDKKDDKK